MRNNTKKNPEELKALVVKAQQGDEDARGAVHLAMYPFTEQLFDSLFDIIEDLGRVSDRFYKTIENCINNFQAGNFFSFCRQALLKEFSDIKNRRYKTMFAEKKPAVSLVSGGISNKGNEKKLSYIDTIPVDNDVYSYEAVDTSLSLPSILETIHKGDERKRIILTGWLSGKTDRAIARILLQTLGGVYETHRKFIARFKEKLQETFKSGFPDLVSG